DLAAARELIAPVAVDPTGALLPAVAESVGLPAGLPVVSAPYDLVASATGAGVERDGEGLLIVGTTLACEVLHEEVTLTGERAGLTLATGTGTAAFRAMPAMVGAATIDWVLGIVGHTVHDLPALLAEPPSTAVRALPFLAHAGERAPFRDPRARGRFDGITLTTTAADLVRAVVEALAFSARACFEAAGLDGRLRACGGGSRGPLTQVFSDALDTPIDRCTDPEVGARGAAIHAARAVGAEPPPPSPTDLVSPRRPHATRYAEAFATYLADVDAARAQWAGAAVPAPTGKNS
ncbi:FGGY-family carbohydrate kinase, partial [Pseudactinotalea sp.]|uniref:FGGY-family carbohydrate kinase n=1 Tax=Pseudactinotalea sp. TaxID=1926260 RepID=UPI003B3A3731